LRDTSRKLFARATRVIPGGVNSPVRAWRAIDDDPMFVVRGRGATVFDADGTPFIDLVNAWGPLILGHAHPEVLQAVSNAVRRGLGFGAPTTPEIDLAEAIIEAFPSIEKVRLVTSGTEATMTALRIARAATGRKRILKFAGCYHGHSDGLLVRAGSGAATFGVPDSAGIPEEISALTSVAEFGDLGSVREALSGDPPVAAVILEPIPANMGVIPPDREFLAGLIDLARSFGALVIFDEVISGFRVARGGAQERFGLSADLTCLGKILGGGLPMAAVGGRADLMDLLAPLGPVYQAGTMSGNPIACIAGRETLRLLGLGTYTTLERRGSELAEGLEDAIRETGAHATVQRVGSMLTLFFGVDRVRSWSDASHCDTAAFAGFFRAMLERGVNLPPSQYEAWFLSMAHGDAEISAIVEAARAALRS
jgi:glutamate-1-semialdehyde 2,1-aminomutase